MKTRLLTATEMQAILDASNDAFERVMELSKTDAAHAISVLNAKLIFASGQYTEQQARALMAQMVEVTIDHWRSMTDTPKPPRQ